MIILLCLKTARNWAGMAPMLMANGRDLAKAQEIIVFFKRYAEM